MRITFQKIQIFYFFLIAAVCTMFINLATTCYFSDSEIWLMTLSKGVFSPQHGNHTIYYKWFFHAVVNVTSFWSKNNLAVYETSRLVFAFISLASVFLIAGSFSSLYQRRQLFLPITIICFTSSLFFNQGFRVRADVLALFLHSLFLFVVFGKLNPRWKSTAILILINVALLLTTAKSLLFITLHVFIGIYLFVHQENEKKMLAKKILYSVLIPTTFGLFALSCLAFTQPNHPFLFALQTSADFYMKSFDPGLGGAAFFKPLDFMYLTRFLRLSLVHTFLFVIWLILFSVFLFSKSKKSWLRSFSHLYCGLLLVQVLLYNQKLPFFLGPFLTPLIALQFCLFDHFSNSRKILRWLSPLLLTLASWLCYKQFLINKYFNNNYQQKQFVSALHDYKRTNPDVTVYDIIGLLPQNNTYNLFIGPGEVSRRDEIFSHLLREPPDIYLYTYKNIFFGNTVNEFLKKNYFEHSPGVWLKSQNIRFDQDLGTFTQILRHNQKNYWVIAYKKSTLIYSHTTKGDVLADCLFLDSQFKPTQNDIQWLAIPFHHLRFSIVSIPPPQFDQSPFDLFRFDTSF